MRGKCAAIAVDTNHAAANESSYIVRSITISVGFSVDAAIFGSSGATGSPNKLRGRPRTRCALAQAKHVSRHPKRFSAQRGQRPADGAGQGLSASPRLRAKSIQRWSIGCVPLTDMSIAKSAICASLSVDFCCCSASLTEGHDRRVGAGAGTHSLPLFGVEARTNGELDAMVSAPDTRGQGEHCGSGPTTDILVKTEASTDCKKATQPLPPGIIVGKGRWGSTTCDGRPPAALECIVAYPPVFAALHSA